MFDFVYSYVSLQTLMWLVVGLPLAGAVLNGLLAIVSAQSEGARFRPWVTIFGCLAPVAALVASIIIFFTLMGFEVGQPSAITGPLVRWIASPDLVIDFGLKADQLSLVMILLVAGVGALVHIYSVGYMGHDAGYARFFALMNLFLFFMLLLVLADNLVLMFFGWEGVSLCSYLLIGYWFDDESKARAGTKAFVLNRIGDVGMLSGMFLIFGVMSAAGVGAGAGVFNFETMERYGAYFVPVATVLALLLFAGAVGKSAQMPLYVWLPDAMAGPTPVSAFIHAATMVAAGVYMVARLGFIFALSPVALEVVATVGTVTAVSAALMSVTSCDIKRALAYSTISQLGYMFLAAGLGAFTVAMFHLVTHAFFKALLFLSAGSVIMALDGCQDIRSMGGLKRRMPVTAWTFLIAAASLAGIFPLSGFFSKELILWQAYERGATALWVAGFAGAGISAFYVFRLAGAAFFGTTNAPEGQFKKVEEAPVSMVVPQMVLATAVVLLGVLGVPQALGGTEVFITWLGGLIPYEISRAPAEGPRSGEIILMVITVLWSLHFSILGWLIYAQKRDWPPAVAARLKPIYLFLANGFYVDWIYNFLIVRPSVWVSKNIIWHLLDDIFIDGLAVEGSARTIGFMGRLVSAAQTGVLQRYLLYFLIGAVLLVGYLAL